MGERATPTLLCKVLFVPWCGATWPFTPPRQCMRTQAAGRQHDQACVWHRPKAGGRQRSSEPVQIFDRYKAAKACPLKHNTEVYGKGAVIPARCSGTVAIMVSSNCMVGLGGGFKLARARRNVRIGCMVLWVWQLRPVQNSIFFPTFNGFFPFQFLMKGEVQNLTALKRSFRSAKTPNPFLVASGHGTTRYSIARTESVPALGSMWEQVFRGNPIKLTSKHRRCRGKREK